MASEFMKDIETIEVLVSAIFEEKPERWGLRGDPYLWEDLKKEFSTVSVTISLEDFEKEFKAAFEKLTGTPLTRDCHLFLSQYAHGGMSNGQISGEFWFEEALPLLVERLKSFK